MHIPPDGMQPTEAMRVSQRRQQAIFLSVVVILNVIVLTWTFWPSKPTSYEECLMQMADKAKGNATIFNRLTTANCYRLSPAYIEQNKNSADKFLDE